jgi:(E)-2-((N-methylformamido)methylene)succinate hydrolase
MSPSAGKPRAPLVFIHGVSDSHASWNEVISDLGPDFESVAYDLRGHGTAPTRPLVYGIDDFVDDLLAVLDENQISEANLIGFSLGGLIAQRAAIREPARVRTLTVIGSVAGRTAEEKERVLERLHQIETLGPVGVAELSVERWFTPAYLVAHPEARQEVIDRMAALDKEAYVAAYRVLATTDLADDLHLIKAPTLAIAGEFDIGSPPRMSELIAIGTGGRLVVLPDVRHNLLIESHLQIGQEISSHVS